MGSDGNSRLKLPEDLLIEIFLRSSVKSLVRAKYVCKKWCIVLKDHKFTLKHIQYQKTHNKGRLFLQYYREDTEKYNYALFDDETLVKERYHNLVHGCGFIQSTIEGPVNGLYCLFDRWDRIVLWNPALMEFRIIPLPHHHFFPEVGYLWAGIGFGIDPRTHEYKLVHIGKTGTRNSITPDVDMHRYITVYSFTTNTWRLVYDIGFSPMVLLHFLREINGLFLNGTHYWATRENERQDIHYIIGFDMGEDTFRKISGPSPSNFCYDDRDIGYDSFTLYDDDKFAFVCLDNYSVDIWVMRQEEEGVWTKQLSITSLPRYHKTVGLWKKDGYICVDYEEDIIEQHQIILCNIGNLEMKYFGPKGHHFEFESSVYYESLVSVDCGIIQSSCTSIKTVLGFLDSSGLPP